MTPSEAIAVACEQKLWWCAQEVTAAEAWFRLTGIRRREIDWAQVEAWMIRWQLSQDFPEALAA